MDHSLQGKTFLVSGVANKKSVATFIGKALVEAGAHCVFSVQRPEMLEAAQKLFPHSPFFICDVEKTESIQHMALKIREQNIQLDGMVHSLAFANFPDIPRTFMQTPWNDFSQAAKISCFSLVELCEALKEQFLPSASIVTISISNTRATSYGYLGPIKAMLDGVVPYLARAFSDFSHIRVNAVGAGPLKTSASAGIPNYVDNYLFSEALTMRKKGLETQEVANTALFLLSPKSSGINAQTLIVDAGMSANGFDQAVVKAFIKGQSQN